MVTQKIVTETALPLSLFHLYLHTILSARPLKWTRLPNFVNDLYCHNFATSKVESAVYPSPEVQAWIRAWLKKYGDYSKYEKGGYVLSQREACKKTVGRCGMEEGDCFFPNRKHF
jgi:hypothetical protein